MAPGTPKAISPGATLGMLGGGQLGRFFTCSALEMGYRVTVLDPDPLSPAGRLATRHIAADYTDTDALKTIKETCAAVSIEFESVPAAALRVLHGKVRLTPSVKAVEIAQNRLLEKAFIRDHGLASVRFAPIHSYQDCASAFADVQGDCIIKTSTLGYDGKGQAVCRRLDEVQAAFSRFGEVPCILEEKISLHSEVSVVLARFDDGQVSCFPVADNIHRNGILDVSIAPASVADEIGEKAQQLAVSLTQALDYVGVIGVEMFVTQDQQVLINEIAPRPHNSGHYTLDATNVSQFDQQVRVLCGLEPASVTLTSPVVMLNLLGDIWDQGEPDWQSILPGNAVLYLYGKAEPRPGRKMGHINVFDDSTEKALNTVRQLKKLLNIQE